MTRSLLSKLLFVGFCFGSTIPLAAQTWSQAYTGLGDLQILRSLAAREDGTIAVSGSFHGGACVLEIGGDGAPRQARCFSSDESLYVTPLPDGYLIYGSATDPQSIQPGRNPIVSGVAARLDRGLNVVWSRRFDDPDQAIARFTSAVATSDGGLALAGTIEPSAWMVKLRADGTVAWQRRYDLSETEMVEQIAATHDGGVVLAGRGRGHPWVLRVNAKGDVLWQAFSGLPGFASAVAVQPGGGIVAGGMTYGDGKQWIALLDGSGRFLWQRVGSERGSVAHLFVDSKGSITAYASRLEKGGQFASFSSEGQIQWQRGLGIASQNEHDRAAAVRDGLLVGRRTTAGGLEIYKLDSQGRGDACARALAVEVAATWSAATAVTTFDLDRLEGRTKSVAVSREGRSVATAATKASCEVAPASERSPAIAAVASPTNDAMVRLKEEQDADAARARDLLNRRDFKALEAIAEELRKSRATYRTGLSKLVIFYEGLSEPVDEQQEGAHLQLLSAWRSAEPRSAAAAIASAEAFLAYGHRARGSDTSSTISESGRRRYRQLLAAAANLLDSSAPFAASDPYYWVTRVSLAGLTCDGLDHVVRTAAAREPRFPQIFISASMFYLPRWCGSEAEFRGFAEFAAGATKAHFGDALYALVAWTAVSMESENAITTFGLDWARMRRGFEDYLKRYPDATNWYHRYALSAWKASDRETARRLFATPHLAYGAVAEDVWESHGAYSSARNWAMTDPALDLMRPTAPARPADPPPLARRESVQQPAPPTSSSALRKPAERSWISTAAADWPPLFMTNRLELTDGTIIGGFQSFLVDSGNGIVAITAMPVSSDRGRSGMVMPAGVPPVTHPMSIAEIRAEMKSWRMDVPSQPRKTLTVATIEPMPKRNESRSLVLTVKSPTKELPVRPLTPLTKSFGAGGRVYIVACAVERPACAQTAYTAEVSGISIGTGQKFGHLSVRLPQGISGESMAGSPVLNEDGLVIAVMSGNPTGLTMVDGQMVPLYAAEEVGRVLIAAGIWTE